MAVLAVMDETLDLRVASSFDGNFSALPPVWISNRQFLPSRHLQCNGHRVLYVARPPDDIVGGTLDGTGHPVREVLAIYVLTDLVDIYPQETHMRDIIMGFRFFWISPHPPFQLRRADLTYGTDNMLSLAVTAYPENGAQRHLAVHRIVAFTFLLTPRLYSMRWDRNLHVEHIDVDHGTTLCTTWSSCERRALMDMACARGGCGALDHPSRLLVFSTMLPTCLSYFGLLGRRAQNATQLMGLLLMAMDSPFKVT